MTVSKTDYASLVSTFVGCGTDMSYIVVPEDIIHDAAAAFLDEENSFSRLLVSAEEFKAAGMTPMFLLDNATMELLVVCKETFNKKLN